MVSPLLRQTGVRGGLVGARQEGIPASQLLDDVEPEDSFLVSLGKVVDWPGRLIRSTLVGQPLEAFGGEYITGWDMLKKLGIKDKPGKFDAVDVAAFLTEVVLDPLTYAGGLGALTKAGRAQKLVKGARGTAAASMASVKAALPKGVTMAEFMNNYRKAQKGLATPHPNFKRAFEAMGRVQDASAVQGKNLKVLREMNAPTELAATWGAQAAQDIPSRSFLSAKIPFTEYEKVLIAGAPLVGAIGAVGKGLKGAPVISQMLKLMSPAASKTAEAAPWLYEAKVQMRHLLEEEIQLGGKLGDKAKELLELERKIDPNLSMDDFLDRFMNARESFGIAPGMQKEMNDLHIKLASEIERTREASRVDLAKVFVEQMQGHNTRTKSNIRVNKAKASVIRKYKGFKEGVYEERARGAVKELNLKLKTVDARVKPKINALGHRAKKLHDSRDRLIIEKALHAENEHLARMAAKRDLGLTDAQLDSARWTPDGWKTDSIPGSMEDRAIKQIARINHKFNVVNKSLGTAEARLGKVYDDLNKYLNASRPPGGTHSASRAFSKAEIDRTASLFSREGARTARLGRAQEFLDDAARLENDIISPEMLETLSKEYAETAIPRLLDLPSAGKIAGAEDISTIQGQIKYLNKIDPAAKGDGVNLPWTASPKTANRFKKALDNKTRTMLEKAHVPMKLLKENMENSEKLMQSLRPETQLLVKHIDQELSELLARRVNVGATKARTVMDARLQSLTKRYAERQLTQSARDFLKEHRSLTGKGTLWDDYTKHFNEWSAKTGGDIRRVDEWREKFTTEVNEWFGSRIKDWKKKGYDTDSPEWFNKDFAVTFPAKARGDERSIIMSQMVQSFADFAKKEGGILQDIKGVPGENLVPLGDFLWEHGVHRYKPAGSKVAIEVGSSAHRNKALMKQGIPLDIVDEIRGITGKMTEPSELRKLANIFDRVTGVQRWSLTIPWPGYHSRNFMTNVVLNWMGGVSNPKFYAQAMKAFTDPRERKRLEALGVFTGGWSEQIAKEVFGDKGTFGKLGAALRKKFPKGSKGMDEYRRLVEDVGRAAHYFGKKSKGMTDFDAVESVNKFLLDYSELTGFEKRYARRTFLFYQWTRKMTPLLIEQYFENPSRMSFLTRASTLPTYERPKDLPEFVRASFAVPLPWKDKAGRDQFVTTYGTPLEEFRRFDYTQAQGGGVIPKIGELLKRTVSQMSPPIKQMAEAMAGEDFFYRKDIGEIDRVKQMFGLEKLLPGFREDVMTSGEIRRRANPEFLYFLRNFIGTPRVLSTAQQLGDKEKGALEKFSKVFSGFSTARVYDEDAARVVANMLKKRLLERVPGGMVRKKEIVYPTAPGKEDPSTKLLWEQYQAGLKRQRETQTVRRSRGQ